MDNDPSETRIIRGPLNDDYGLRALRKHIKEVDGKPLAFRARLSLFTAFASDADIAKLMNLIVKNVIFLTIVF